MQSGPAETFHPAHYVRDELIARGWTLADLVTSAGGDAHDALAIAVYLCVQKPELRPGEVLRLIARGFGTSLDLWVNLDATWRQYPDRSERVEIEDALFGFFEAPSPEKAGGDG